MTTRWRIYFACLGLLLLAASPILAQEQQEKPKLHGYVTVRPASSAAVQGLKNELAAKGSTNK